VSALAARDPLMPRSPGGNAPGAAMSLVAHVALVAALAYGVSWRSPAPTPIAAELWAVVPQVAAPPAAESPPPPPSRAAPEPPTVRPTPVQKAPPPAPDPQIAIEKARREKADKSRLEQEAQAQRDKLEREKAQKLQKDRAEAEQQRLAKERAAAETAAKAAEDARLAKQREDNLRRMMGQINGTGEPASRGSAPVAAAPSAAYAGRLVKAIRDNLIFDWRGAGNPAAIVEVRAAPSGTIMGRTLVKSSGHKEWDDAILRAIDRTARLPTDTDGRVPATLTITFRPQD
jgi:colicin import membrane protein